MQPHVFCVYTIKAILVYYLKDMVIISTKLVIPSVNRRAPCWWRLFITLTDACTFNFQFLLSFVKAGNICFKVKELAKLFVPPNSNKLVMPAHVPLQRTFKTQQLQFVFFFFFNLQDTYCFYVTITTNNT